MHSITLCGMKQLTAIEGFSIMGLPCTLVGIKLRVLARKKWQKLGFGSNPAAKGIF